MSVLRVVASDEWTIIYMATIRRISEQLWVITRNENCCEAFIQIRWVLCPIAMNRSSGFNSIHCPAISAKLRCFEIPCQVEKVAHVRGSRMSRYRGLTCRTFRVNLHLPNCLACWVSVSLMRHRCTQPGCKQLYCESKRISDFRCD